MGDVRELVLNARQGDHQAFAGLYDRFAPLVRAVAYDATGCLSEAEDLCQEVFLHAYRNMGQLRDVERFPGWLMMIARRTCASWGRRQQRRPEVGLEEVEAPATASDANDDEIQHVLHIVRQLPPKERMTLHLHYLAGQSVETARQTLGLSSSGFYKVLERAKRRVAAQLERRKVP
jgi:RNA polymerase sigma-70 factor, ECF subfamily